MRSVRLPAPGELAAHFERAGFTASLRVSRADGTPLTDDDIARAEALLAVWEAREQAQRALDAALRLDAVHGPHEGAALGAPHPGGAAVERPEEL